MRGQCSEQQKDLSVYDFGGDQLEVENDSENYMKKTSRLPSSLKSKSNPIEERHESMKYMFLQSFTSGLECKQTGGVSCVDLYENGSQGSSGIDSPERNHATMGKKSKLDENMASSSCFGELGNVCKHEFNPDTLSRVDSLITGASGLDVPLVGNEQASNMPSDGTSVDVISDDEETCRSGSISPPTSASDHVEDEHVEDEHVEDEDDCFAAFGEKDKDDVAVTISPDFVIYKNTLYEKAELLFFTNSILVKCMDTSGNDANIDLEWAIDDIDHIECNWCRSASAAVVKFQLRATAVDGNEYIRDTCDTTDLIISVSDTCWLEKELKIKHLTVKYKDIWKVPQYDTLALKYKSGEGDVFFPREYFTEITESFEDVIYPKGDPDAVSISRRDFELLQPDTFINDTIIDFYIKYLKTKIPTDERHRFHFFNSFFFRKLADLDKDPESASEGRAAFLRVRKWTRKVNIFEKDYIFIPVNFNLHWSLLVICHPGEVSAFKDDEIHDSPKVPCILHMDSIKGSHSGLKNLVQSYLLEEWKERHPEPAEDYTVKFSNLRFVSLELPQQENSFDCGLFLLHYVELFLEESPVYFNPFKISMFSTFLTLDWFIPSEASLKRSLIRKLLCDLLHVSSLKVTPTLCNDILSSRCHDKNMYKKPTVELFNQNSGPSTCLPDNSSCLITVKGIEMNLKTITSPGAVQSDKQEGLVTHDFLGTATDSMATFQEDAPFQIPTFATCPSKEHEDTCEQLLTSNIDRVDGCTAGESSTAPTCSTSSCPKNGLDLFPEKRNEVFSTETGEPGKQISVSIEDCGYVPDSPTSPFGENPEIDVRTTDDDVDGCCRDPQEIDTNKMDEGMSCKDVQKNYASKTYEDGSCKEYQGIDGSSETNWHNVKSDEVSAAEDKGVDTEDFERIDEPGKIERTEYDSKEKDSGQINTCRGPDLVGEDCRVTDAANVVDSGYQNDRTDGMSNESSLAPQDSNNQAISADDRLLVKDGAGLKREEPSSRTEAQYRKRRKISQPGARRRTRSFSRGRMP